MISRYSQFIGLIGQLNNDINDLSSWKGKNDLLNKKISLPIIYLLRYKGNGAEMIRSYYNGTIERDDLIRNQEQIIKIIEESGALLYTEIIKKIYQNKVRDELQYLDIDNNFMNQLLNYLN